MPRTDEGGCPSHFSHCCHVVSRPTLPQFTNAPASFGGVDARRDAAHARSGVVAAAPIATITRIIPAILDKHPLSRSVRRMICLRQHLAEGGFEPLADFDRSLR